MSTLDEIRKRESLATKGPWRGFDNPCDNYWADVHPEDADFIAHARQDIPDLLDYVDRLKEGLRRLEWCDHANGSGKGFGALCPVCGCSKVLDKGGHGPDCWLAELLK
jgi:hypothetical protein